LKYFGFIPFDSKCSGQRQIHIDYEKIYKEYGGENDDDDDDDDDDDQQSLVYSDYDSDDDDW
jgi:hypothetical protein